MQDNYFQARTEHPYHISIGGIVMNKEGKIACHFFDKISLNKTNFENIFILMRETIEPNETIEECLRRGLMEEFGMEAELKSYLGSVVSRHKMGESQVVAQKTTLYFLCDLISLDESKRKVGDLEAKSTIVWLDPKELIPKMKEQAIKYDREDLDESAVLERLI